MSWVSIQGVLPFENSDVHARYISVGLDLCRSGSRFPMGNCSDGCGGSEFCVAPSLGTCGEASIDP
eukprot:4638214-Prymnesium_polylepis.1